MNLQLDMGNGTVHIKRLPDDSTGEDFTSESHIGDIKWYLSSNLKNIRKSLQAIGGDEFKDTIEKRMVFLLVLWDEKKRGEI